MTSDKENLEPDQEPADLTPEADPADIPPESPEPSPEYKDEYSPARAQPRKSSSNFLMMLVLLLLVLCGVGGGGFYLYQEQIIFQDEVHARLTQLETQLNTLDTEAEQTRKNLANLQTLNQELQQFKTEISATLQSHQNALSTLDEDVLRLKEKIGAGPAAPKTSPETAGKALPAEEILPGEVVPQPTEEPVLPEAEPAEESPQGESEEFVQWMEDAIGGFFKAIGDFFVSIWDWFFK
ncbi:MAG: hypothetical protein GWM98_18415 [Nitrospinaceae bacterium]|nr:hypothetical protein [Nitrospinaceae bacterium]NIR56104.1 hypothetical protein [Nitrospinaceae bacterium]NIS86552.1 hypothetical protein [Nitrospinaceae bacterium]NIT83386.1 hypothetical protein [Nitrospinaceae bacterium]NIU45596.1 hypothetical protein [Nitrospinaceae bacterium]